MPAAPRRAFQGGLLRGGALGRRLAQSYALAFAASSAVLLALTVAGLVGVLRERDLSFARAQLRQHVRAYEAEGSTGIRRTAAATRRDDRGEELLVRLADGDNRTLFLLPPEGWTPADVAALGREPARDDGRPVHLTLAPRPGDTGDDPGESVEVFAARLPDGRTAQVGISSDERDDVMEWFPDVFVLIALPLLLLSVAGGAMMARRALRPVRQLVRTFEAIIATGDVRQRAPTPDDGGAVADLFGLFNRMLDRIEALVTGLRRTLDDVAHDLRTPLTSLRGAAEVALTGARTPEAYRDALGDVVEASDAVSAMLDAMMAVAEAEAGALPLRREPVAVHDLVGGVADLYRFVADDRGVTLEVRAEGEGPAVVDRARMRQALANLVDNAVKYTPRGGRVTVEAQVTSDGGLHVVVSDTGVGISPADLPRIWDRLYRGDRSRSERGLGLGLSLVRATVEAHGGRVEAASLPGEGTTVTVHVPPEPPGGPAQMTDL